MKVVLLAGGLGTRISEESHLKPKPMIEIGSQPILWHIMKYYSTFGINEFVLEEELKNLPNKTSKMKKRRIYENQKVQYKKQKRDLYIELEEQTLIYIYWNFLNQKRKNV